jgi:hypothetical protein
MIENSKEFNNLKDEILKYENNLKKSKIREYEIKETKLEKPIKTKINDLTFEQMITELQKVEKMIAAKTYTKKILKDTSSNTEVEDVMKQMKEKKSRTTETKFERTEKIEKMSREDQMKAIEEINTLRDYILISYARENIRELYDQFNSNMINSENFRYEVRKEMAKNKGICEELIQYIIKEEFIDKKVDKK